MANHELGAAAYAVGAARAAVNSNVKEAAGRSECRWRDAWAVLLRFMLGQSRRARLQVWLALTILSFSKPADPSDLVITILAEDQFSFPAATGTDRSTYPGHCRRPRPVLHARALPRDRRRHSRCAADPVPRHGPSGVG